MSQRDVQYILAGRLEPVEDMSEMLEEQIATVESTQIESKLQVMIESARQAGMHDEVIAAILADAHEELFERTID